MSLDRNTLIHRYWIVEDSRLIENILQGQNDFSLFVFEIENYLKALKQDSPAVTQPPTG